MIIDMKKPYTFDFSVVDDPVEDILKYSPSDMADLCNCNIKGNRIWTAHNNRKIKASKTAPVTKSDPKIVTYAATKRAVCMCVFLLISTKSTIGLVDSFG